MEMLRVMQGELLRQQLLLRYCGAVGGSVSDTAAAIAVAGYNESVRRQQHRSLSRQSTAQSAASLDCDRRGSLQLSRAGMTLHDVQVCVSLSVRHVVSVIHVCMSLLSLSPLTFFCDMLTS